MRRTLIALAALAGALPAARGLAQTYHYPDETRAPSPVTETLIQPDDPTRPRRELSHIYAEGLGDLRAHRYRAAAREFNRVTDYMPMNAAGWRALGAAYAGEGQWTQSRRAYARAVYLAADDPVSHAGLGLALKALNSPKAQREAEWLRVRTETCAGTCRDAAVLRVIQTSGPFANAPAT